jgi:CRP-like cAMP-binding protein
MKPPAALGFEQALEASGMPESIRTVDTSVTLALTTEEVRSLVSDNTELVQGLFRMLVERAAAERFVIKAHTTAHLARLSPDRLRPIDTVVVLETVPLFEALTNEATIALGTIARETPLTAGATLFGEADPPAIYVVLSGGVSLDGGNQPASMTAGPGDVIGLFETLAGIPLERRGTVTEAGRALRIDHDELFDLLGQRPVLLQQLFGALFRSPTPQTAAV